MKDVRPGAAVAVLAGRRAAADRSGVLPHQEVRIRRQIQQTLRKLNVQLLIGSAASGADILGLEAAVAEGISFQIIIPLPPADFRARSVTDRGGDWGDRFDALASRARAGGALVEIQPSSDADPFISNNDEVLRLARAVGLDRRVGVFVWNGDRKGPDDATADLHDRAASQGYHIVELPLVEGQV